MVVSRKKSLTLAHAPLTQWGPFFAKWSKRPVWRKTPLTLRSRNGILKIGGNDTLGLRYLMIFRGFRYLRIH